MSTTYADGTWGVPILRKLEILMFIGKNGTKKYSANLSGFRYKKINETKISFLEWSKTEVFNMIVTDIGNHGS